VLQDDEVNPVEADTAVEESRSNEVDGVVDAVDPEDVDETASVAARSVVVVDMPTSSSGDDEAFADEGEEGVGTRTNPWEGRRGRRGARPAERGDAERGDASGEGRRERRGATRAGRGEEGGEARRGRTGPTWTDRADAGGEGRNRRRGTTRVERADAGGEGRRWRRGTTRAIESRPVVESAILREAMGGGEESAQSGRHRQTARSPRGRGRPPSSTPSNRKHVARVPLQGTIPRGAVVGPGKPGNMPTRHEVRGREGSTFMSLVHRSTLRCPLNAGGHGNCLLGAQHQLLCRI